MAERKDCPKCGTAMSFRLGEYDCPQCGHYEAQIKAAKQAEPSGPGFQSQSQWQGGTRRPGAVTPPPPASGTIYQPGQQFGHGMGGYSAAPEFELYPSLNMEMNIYFGLHVVTTLAIIGLLVFVGNLSSTMGSSVDAGIVNAIIAFVVIGSLLRLGFIWFVLYGSVIWLKWCCGGCTAIGILGAIPSLFTTGASVAESPWVGLVDIALSIWFLTIVFRDIQRRQTL